MEKGTRVDQIAEAARRLKSAGIQVGFFLQFGYPGETWGDIQKTLQLVRECVPDDIGISVSYPLPGTTFYERVKLQLGERQNWFESGDLAMLYQGPFSTAFYRQLHRVAHKEFRLMKNRTPSGNRLATRGQEITHRDGYTQPRMKSNRILKRWMKSLFMQVYYTLSLPLEKARLWSLARTKRQGFSALPHSLSPEAAARPTPQVED
jgi:anaerobic magnesium-protoporphyrin IX monomethyl ester cyclase